MIGPYATREDLITLQRVALSRASGTLAERNALMRCAATVARAIRSEDDTQEIPILADPYGPPGAPAAPHTPIE